jgi:hypothetical protein
VLPQTVALATPPGESQGGSESESIIFSTFQARNRTLGRDVVVGVAQSNTGYFVTKCDVVNITEIPTTTPATTSTTTTPVITTPTPTPSETPTQTPCPPLKLDPIPNQKSKVNEDYYINLSEYISLVDGQSFEQTLTSLRELEGSDPENVFHIRKGLNNEYLLTSSKPINITLQALFTYCAGQIMQELNFNVNVTDSKTPITPGPDDSYKFDPNYLALLSLIVPLATLLYCLNKHCRQREEDNQNQVEGDGQPMTADTFSNQEEEKQEEGITDQANINQQQVEMLGLDPHSPYSPSIQSPSAIDPDFEQPEQDPSATFHLRGTPTSILENEEDKGQTLS